MVRRRLGLGVLALFACQAPTSGGSDGGGSDGGSISSDGGLVVIGKKERLTSSADPAAPLINLTQWNWNRQIAVDDAGGVHVVWAQLGTTNINLPADRPDPVDAATLPPGQIFYKRSNDRGESWSSDFALTARGLGTDSATIAVDGQSIHVAWRALDGGRLRAFVRSSSDGGASWGPPVAVSDNPVGIGISAPAMAAAGGALYAVWADGRQRSIKEIQFSRSSDGGNAWSPARPISAVDGFSSWTPAIAVVRSAVHVAWTDERNDVGECTRGGNPCREEEYYRRSLDGGATWDDELRLSDDPAESWAPSLAASGDAVHLAWLDKRTGFFQVYYRRSSDGGASFAETTRIPSDPAFANAARPTLAARSGEVHLTWFGFTDFEADIYYARSRDDGASWSPFVNLTADAPGAARVPHVDVAPDRAAHLVWYDTRFSDAAGPRIELFYARVDER